MSQEQMEKLRVLRYADSDVRRCRVRWCMRACMCTMCTSVNVSPIPIVLYNYTTCLHCACLEAAWLKTLVLCTELAANGVKH